MKSYKNIIEDIKEPSPKDLWLNNGELKYFGSNGWESIKSGQTISWDDIENNLKENLSPVAFSGNFEDMACLNDSYYVLGSMLSNKYLVQKSVTTTYARFEFNASVTTLSEALKNMSRKGGGSFYSMNIPINVPIVSSTSAGVVSPTQYEKWNSSLEYSLPTATDEIKGGILTGYQENGKNYAVKVDENGKAYVTVNWSDTNTTYTEATTTKSGLMSSSDKSKLDGIAANANNYVLPSASTSALGGVKQVANVTDITIDGAETAATVGEKVNELLAALRSTGILQS